MSAQHDLVERLEHLAAQAPGRAVDPEALWVRGRRRQRARLGVAAAAVAVLGLLGVTTTPLLLERAQQVEPARADDLMVLPDLIRQPGGWEPAFEGNPGRLSAVGFGARQSLFTSRAAWWGVSAATGESRFLELPEAADSIVAPALSADGWWLAYWITGDVPGEPLTMDASEDDGVAPVVGVGVLDLRTGSRDVWRIDSDHGLATGGLAWAGDVLWWSAGPLARSGATAVMARDVVARTWDVATDERDEPRGKSAQVTANGVGDAPDGFVDEVGRRRLRVVTEDTGPRVLRTTLPDGSPRVAGSTDATMSPDGARIATLLMPDAGLFDERPKTVLVGGVGDGAVDLRPVAGVEEQGIAGWRSPSELVVTSQAAVEDGRPQQALRAWTVDVTTGARAPLLEFSGNTPQVAAEAWAAEVVDAPDAPLAPDPRLVGLGGTVLLVFCVSLWRDLRRRRGHP